MKTNRIETWANISTRKPEERYVSPAEFQRMERVAVGRICGCGACLCCEELKTDKEPKWATNPK